MPIDRSLITPLTVPTELIKALAMECHHTYTEDDIESLIETWRIATPSQRVAVTLWAVRTGIELPVSCDTRGQLVASLDGSEIEWSWL